jgi:mxaJ protein
MGMCYAIIVCDRRSEIAVTNRVPWAKRAAAVVRTVAAAGSVAGAILVTASISMASAEEQDLAGGLLRVCADPHNLPYSNDKGQGFENRLAVLFAAKLNARLVYSWFPEGAGAVPNTLGSESCDLVLGYDHGIGLSEDTNPYYYTSYALVYRKGDQSLAGVDSLSDRRLLPKKIGVAAGTLPMSIMAIDGLAANAKLFANTQVPGGPAAAMIAEIASGALDAAILWGPIGGYIAKSSKVPLTLVPLAKEKTGPHMLYGITMGIRPNEPEWKHKLNRLIAENQDDINAILLDYDLPLLDDQGNEVKRATAER